MRIRMSNPHNPDLITATDFAVKIYKTLPKVPKLLKGLKMANNKDLTKNVGLGWAFEKAVSENPNGTAIIFEDYRISYRDLNNWANQIANYYIAKGMKKGDVVAVYMDNRTELLCFCIAMAKIGAIAALVNNSQFGKVLVHSINLVNAKYVVVGDEVFSQLNEVVDDLNVPKENFYWWADTQTLNNAGNAPTGFNNLALAVQDQLTTTPSTSKQVFKNDGLFYIYTSGTTGLPKAVIFNHGRWMKAYGLFGHIADLNQNDVMYITLPMYHATGSAVCWSTVIKGAATMLLRRKFSVSSFWADVHKYDVSGFGYVGELCRYLVDLPPSELDGNHRVKKMIGNGMRPNIWHKFKDRFGVEEVYEFYASSEGNVGFSNIFNFENTVGFSPLPYKIVQYDKEADEVIRDVNGFCVPVEKGGTGLLIGEITDKTPFDGYTDPEKSKKVIMTDVIKKGDKYFNTGDLMRDIGFKHAQFVDRLGDTFRWKGENVSTTEVENMISDLPKIHEAIVYGVEITGTNGRAGMVALTTQDDAPLTAADCTALLPLMRQSLPHYAVPVFVRLLTIVEQTGTFKYSKNRLKEVAFNPDETSDTLLVCLPKTDEFVEVTPKLYEQIQGDMYRF